MGIAGAAGVMLEEDATPVETGILAAALLQDGAAERPISKTQAIVPRKKLNIVRVVLFIRR